jgi:murein DD-endopeptidase MepM/ murein hydrolase activator NlpD
MVLRSDIPSGFGVILQRSSGIHQGVDLLSRVGRDVTAADAGQVALKGTSSTWGKYVVLAHQNDEGKVVSYTAYMHLSSNNAVELGQTVGAGDVLGQSGTTGNASGAPPHLHFEIWTSLKAAQKGSGLKYRIDPRPNLKVKP